MWGHAVKRGIGIGTLPKAERLSWTRLCAQVGQALDVLARDSRRQLLVRREHIHTERCESRTRGPRMRIREGYRNRRRFKDNFQLVATPFARKRTPLNYSSGSGMPQIVVLMCGGCAELILTIRHTATPGWAGRRDRAPGSWQPTCQGSPGPLLRTCRAPASGP